MQAMNLFSFETPIILIYALFPYTTLFRSLLLDRVESHGPERLRRTARSAELLAGLTWQSLAVKKFLEIASDCQVNPARRDRKSTRLNSSHMSISYAVF